MPRKRAQHALIYFENKLEENNDNKINGSVSYNLVDKRWELLPSLNYTRDNPSLCLYNKSYLYAFRGGFRYGRWLNQMTLECAGGLVLYPQRR